MVTQPNRMARFSQERLTKLIRGIGVRQIRLACGLVLFAYLVSHFLNHALGNISMDALADGVYYHTVLWQFLPVAITFYTAALLHAGLGIWALYQRRQFRWRAIEPLQLVLGLSIPALIIAHIAGVRLGQSLFGQEKAKPYDGVNVTIRSTRTSAGLVTIEAQSTLWRPVESKEYRAFVFTCRVGKRRCVAPEVGQTYVLQAPNNKDTQCDGYILGRELRLPVCLVSVH